MRVFGISLAENKQIRYAMTAIFGIGLSRATSLAKEAGIDPLSKTKDISEKDEAKLRALIEALTLEGNLKRQISVNIKRLKDIDSYRGGRHSRKLPARGQRTKTNSRTVRGNRRNTMGSGRRSVDKK